MPRKGQTVVQFNDFYFDQILKTAEVEALSRESAEKALEIARQNAPVDDGDYKRGLHIEVKEAKFRKVVRVVGDDAKTLLIEAKTGNLARALKAAKK
ncbi:HK97 gp10 family phage protein [Herbiconiux sp.]|uniref:HK97 gp10 family phage protein n=1 Tax=Herbiconiux sp. TaxID=1871186 RepID=UPI0025BEDCD6|nr:HK97 gp10 family phage protein [Herbiconiux sp.]